MGTQIDCKETKTKTYNTQTYKIQVYYILKKRLLYVKPPLAAKIYRI